MDVDLQKIRDAFEHDLFAKGMGAEIVELEKGYTKTRFTVEKKHLNGVGIAQGGTLFTLADFAFAVASNSSGRVAVSISSQISFMRPSPTGTVLTAEAREIARSGHLSHCEVNIRNEKDQLVATFHGTGYIKDIPFPPETAE
jgi:acyl-CoA thioesterase